MIPLRLQPLTGFHTATYPPGATFGPRNLNSYELVWLLEGDAVYQRGDQTWDAPAGSFVLCRPPAVDSFRWDPLRRTHHAYFHFHLEGGDLPPEWSPPNAWPTVRLSQRDEDLLPTLFRGLLAWGDTQRNPYQTEITALTLLAAFVTGNNSFQPTTPQAVSLPEPVRLALTEITVRLDTDSRATITLHDLARAASVTPEHLCRLFKTATGQTPLETVRRQRLDTARTLLIRTNYSITEIAALCGFESPFHFSRRFKAFFGHAPRDLRKMQTNRQDAEGDTR